MNVSCWGDELSRLFQIIQGGSDKRGSGIAERSEKILCGFDAVLSA
jgi:hypothetical protein